MSKREEEIRRKLERDTEAEREMEITCIMHHMEGWLHQGNADVARRIASALYKDWVVFSVLIDTIAWRWKRANQVG